MPRDVQPHQRCIHDAFTACAGRRPDAVAIRQGQREVTYKELDRTSSRLANYLIARGVRGGSPVAVLMERSAEMITTLLGILKAGGAYVPLNPEDPARRIDQIIRDARPYCIVTQHNFGETLSGHLRDCVYIDDDLAAISSHPAVMPAVETTLGDLAYICFTSGSTGIPKGVCVPHRGVIYLAEMDHYDASDTFLQIASLAFDSSVFEIWACLLSGGRLVLYPPWPPTPEGIAQLVHDEQVSVLLLSTGLFHRTVDGPVDSLGSVRHLIVGGDVMSPEHARRAWHALPACHIKNGYGVTESTCLSCCYDLVDEPAPGPPVPIGRPITGTRAYVLDDDRQPCGPGQQGELYLAGEGLADRYLGQAELTANRFLPDPFFSGGRMYRTGDLASRRNDGVLEFHGRVDAQIKIRGFRVEPGEIKTFLEAQPGVRQAVVIGQRRHPETSDLQLNAYITTNGEAGVTARVRAAARRTLPSYMIPTNVLVVDEIPLTRNGKIDRAALPRPPQRRVREVVNGYEPPRSVLEAILCDLVAETLRLCEIGIRDDFRELGGDSLTAAELSVAINEAVGGTVTPRMLYGSWTVAGLAERLKTGSHARSLPGGSGMRQ